MSEAPLTRELPCPSCGYDLRALTGDRCPECGTAVDRAALDVSAIPWAHRRRIGRVRAYVRTARLFGRGAGGLRDEVLRPQDSADARAFARVTGVILGLVLVWAWGVAIWLTEGGVYEAIAWEPRPRMSARVAWIDDLMVPWSAGATIAWVMPVGLFLLGGHLARVQRTVFRARRRSASVRRAAVALSAYAAAPLLLLVPAAVAHLSWVWVGGLRSHWARDRVDEPTGLKIAWLGLIVIAVLLAAAAIVGTLLTVGRWVARATAASASRVAVAVAELVALWAAGAVLFLFVFPWLVGFGWVVLDSFR